MPDPTQTTPEQTYRRCEVVLGPPRSLNPCEGLNELIGRSHGGKGGGLYVAQMTSRTTHKPTREAWVLFSGQHSRRGMNLNFCPMCGADFELLIYGSEETVSNAAA